VLRYGGGVRLLRGKHHLRHPPPPLLSCCKNRPGAELTAAGFIPSFLSLIVFGQGTDAEIRPRLNSSPSESQSLTVSLRFRANRFHGRSVLRRPGRTTRFLLRLRRPLRLARSLPRSPPPRALGNSAAQFWISIIPLSHLFVSLNSFLDPLFVSRWIATLSLSSLSSRKKKKGKGREMKSRQLIPRFVSIFSEPKLERFGKYI